MRGDVTRHDRSDLEIRIVGDWFFIPNNPSYCLVMPSSAVHSFICSSHAARRTQAYGYAVLKRLYFS
jgi:hypothetical protein